MKKNIMKRAHEIARNLEGHYRARMSLALRQAWEEERKVELVKLTGSEKQIAWAEDIRRGNIEYLEDQIENFERRAAEGDDFPEIRASLQKGLKGLTTLFSEAKWWIEHKRIAWAMVQKIITGEIR